VTISELRTLERLFTAVESMRSRMDDRFDAQDERLRAVEEFVTNQSAQDSFKAKALAERQIARDQSTITKRWVIGILATFGTILTGVIGIVFRLVKDGA
jgi:hypothetical protein